MTMNDNNRPPGRADGADRAVNDPGRLAEYEARTRDPLDLLALATLWLVVVPRGDFGHEVTGIVFAFRVALSAVYAIDIAIRSVLAPVTFTMRSPIRWPLSRLSPAGARAVQHPAGPVGVPARAPGPVPGGRRCAGHQRRGHRVPGRAARSRLQHPHRGGRAVVVLCHGHHLSATATFTRSPPGAGSPRASSWPPGC